MKPEANLPRQARKPLIFAALTAAAGLILSFSLQSRIAQTETEKARLTAETLRLNTEQELILFGEVLESVCALHALSDAVGQAAMDEFIAKGLIHQHAVLGPFGLTQKIPLWLRISLDEAAQARPGTGYRVVQKGPDGSWVPAGLRPAYYPLTWESRTGALNLPVGFDFASWEEARRTIERIEQTHRTALVPTLISPSEAGSAAYWVFAPVIPRKDGPGTPETVIGLAVANLSPESLLQRVAARAVPASRLNITLLPAAETAGTAATVQIVRGEWLCRHPLEALDARWLFECSLPLSVTGRRSLLALAAGLLITALMTSQLLVLGGRTAKIEAEVLARTEELRIAKTRLEETLHERARLEEEMSELAAHEQQRMGRDLHDSLGQKLTGAVFLSRSLLNWFQKHGAWGMEHEAKDRKPESTPATGNQQPVTQLTHARTLNETLKSAVNQVRNMARGLAPVTLSDENLGEALRQLTEEMTGLYGVSCELAECGELPGLNRKTKEQLYLIAREAVNNAARHAQAGLITVRLRGDDSAWALFVEDDGCGLPAEMPAEGGMGIRIMRHRAGLIGASFAITSVPHHGTSIKIASGQR